MQARHGVESAIKKLKIRNQCFILPAGGRRMLPTPAGGRKIEPVDVQQGFCFGDMRLFFCFSEHRRILSIPAFSGSVSAF